MNSLKSDSSHYFLQSKRLGFRIWRPKDLPLALALWGDPEVTQFIDARGKLSDEQVKAILDRNLVMQEKHGVQYWPIFLLAAGEHVGCCGLRPYSLPEGVYELGTHLRPVWWGRGLAEEAARAVIEYAFDRLGVSALFAGHNPNNHASRALVKKLGFCFTHDEFHPATGLNHPSYILRRTSPLS